MTKIIYLVLFCAGIFIYVRYLEYKSTFYPAEEFEGSPADTGLAFQDVSFKATDGRELHGWFMPYEGAEKVLVFCHGNAGNISHRLDKIDLLYRLGINIFIFDYRGYGKSRGRPSEAGLYRDSEGAYNYLIDKRNFSPGDIIVFGESLGSAAAVDLSSRRQVGGLILESVFTNSNDMGRRIYPFIPTFLYTSKFDSLGKIKKINCPKLIMHSRDDEIIPFGLAEKVFEASSQPKQFVRLDGPHNEVAIDSREKYISAVKSFLDKL